MHWLRELVDIDVSSEELAIKLSNTSAAVDSIERFAEGVSGVVAGRVLEVADVPESDKLVIAKIDVGEGSPVTILAGAKNFSAGDVVPVAREGARVTTLDVPITNRKMVGGKYTSQGMLCSARELGVADEHEGILVLGADTPVGTDIAQLLGLDDDVLEFEIYPNRPDQMSVLGIAREVALLYGKQLRSPDTTVVEGGPDAASLTSVAIEDDEGCPRYLARVIEDVSFGASPALVRARLTACGVRPLGNLIDATNYVLLLTGQPLHAFDLDKLAEQRIAVRRARAGEKLTTLDGEERVLDPTDLVIADGNDAQALAGVMGGGHSEVGADTKRVLLESAYFQPVSIARTSRRHHLRSEASARFERGADPEMVPDAASIAAELIRRWAGGKVATGALDEGGAPEHRTVTLRPSRVTAVLGIEVSSDEIVRLLTGLGCEVTVRDNTLDAVVPSWRPDLEREIDLIEEVARLHGYEEIPSVLRPGDRGGRTDAQLLRERTRAALLGAGLSEATLSTFGAREDIEAIGYDGPLVVLSNPMTEDQRQLRPSLFPGLLRATQRNVAHGTPTVRLFEFGRVFRGWPEGAKLPDESEHVAFVLHGDLTGHWSLDDRFPDAYDGLGLIDLVLGELGIEGRELSTDDVARLFHPGRSANVMLGGTMIGRFGELRPSVARSFDLEGPVVVGGLAVEPLFARPPSDRPLRALPTQPPVLRHISMWLPEGVAAGDVITAMRQAGGEFLERVDVLDEYRPETQADERRSVAFGLTFRARDRTLRAEEVDSAREAIVAAVTSAFGVEIR
jgi:phenylalanyl-tRNA synthetase beta chain